MRYSDGDDVGAEDVGLQSTVNYNWFGASIDTIYSSLDIFHCSSCSLVFTPVTITCVGITLSVCKRVRLAMRSNVVVKTPI